MKRIAKWLLILGMAFLLGALLVTPRSFAETDGINLHLSVFLYLGGFGLLLSGALLRVAHYCIVRKFKWPSYIVMILCGIAGTLIWTLSPPSERPQLWNDTGLTFLSAMAIAGLTSGILAPQSWFLSWVGIFTGQLFLAAFGFGIYALPLGALVVLSGSIPALITAFLSSWAVTRFGRKVPLR